ncbi:hypothetical protein SEVIR_4G157200v4 [Setaria viridis]|uniref:B box-type domain-containing protein n=1 Tax=Setaria viridis TaxID=4556 RepID=A0A4U6UZ39_SETVI|nr:B-box zinc finger protein 32-like [Setaria viridis]TKW21978.1 hypothetical protein SEVIR_4G157200v2 [Setaria viridis]
MGRDGGVVWPGAGRSCELCGAPAAVHCAADAAFLCAACDAKVHGANFLASRHRRTRLAPAAARCGATLESSSSEEDGHASAASSCVSTADSASTASAARRRRGGRARAATGRTPGRGAAARRAEAVLECWAKRMGLAPGAARRRAAAAWRALRASGADAVAARVPPRVAMAAALWWEVAAASGGASHGDALRRLEACAHVPVRLVVAVATSLARARARRRTAEEGWDECAWAGPKSNPARS